MSVQAIIPFTHERPSAIDGWSRVWFSNAARDFAIDEETRLARAIYRVCPRDAEHDVETNVGGARASSPVKQRAKWLWQRCYRR
jgi:hypothetical protein